MLISMRGLRGKRVEARDRGAGTIHDICFSDRDWRVRYLMLDLGAAALGKRVQLEPSALEQVGRKKPGSIDAKLTWSEIESLPPTASDPPVAVQNEVLPSAGSEPKPPDATEDDTDPHLRCTKTLGYFVEARDSEVGRIRDFLVTPADWRVPFFVVDSQALAPEREIVLSTDLIEEMRWVDTTARIPLDREKFVQVSRSRGGQT